MNGVRLTPPAAKTNGGHLSHREKMPPQIGYWLSQRIRLRSV